MAKSEPERMNYMLTNTTGCKLEACNSPDPRSTEANPQCQLCYVAIGLMGSPKDQIIRMINLFHRWNCPNEKPCREIINNQYR